MSDEYLPTHAELVQQGRNYWSTMLWCLEHDMPLAAMSLNNWWNWVNNEIRNGRYRQ